MGMGMVMGMGMCMCMGMGMFPVIAYLCIWGLEKSARFLKNQNILGKNHCSGLHIIT